jgi:hypothetical protein
MSIVEPSRFAFLIASRTSEAVGGSRRPPTSTTAMPL